MTAKEILYDWGGTNLWLFQVINLPLSGPADAFMGWVSAIGSYWNLPLIAGTWLIVAILMQRANSSKAPCVLIQLRRLALGAAIAFAATAGLKLALNFPRPAAVLSPGAVRIADTGTREHSLPSGHASFAALVAASIWPLIGRPARFVVALVVLAIGLSRIRLGAHFPADVLAGYAVGLGSALLSAGLSARSDIGSR